MSSSGGGGRGGMEGMSRSSKGSHRLELIVNEIFEKEALNVPFAVMTRANAVKAARDDLLTRSEKVHVREGISRRAAQYEHE
mmetsp:Transcript_34268/g.74069  ORF Transcript_34268/g.74069 Transcript_34268/m.74069 type:complete len:82 (+) Transcript_34268:1-246(+)